MFNIGGGEALVIALIALIVLGPNRLPEAARTVGKVVGEVRRLSTGFQNEVRDAFKDVDADTPPPTSRKRESTPLGAAVDELNASSDARDDLAPEPVEASEPARPASTMAEADRGPSTSVVPAPAGGVLGNGRHAEGRAEGEVAPEVADALDEILATPSGPRPAGPAAPAPPTSSSPPASPATSSSSPPEADTAP